jgi:hypothetical protein
LFYETSTADLISDLHKHGYNWLYWVWIKLSRVC